MLYFSTNGIIKQGIILKWSIVILYKFYYTICRQIKHCNIIPCFIKPFVEKWSIVILYMFYYTIYREMEYCSIIPFSTNGIIKHGIILQYFISL
jgi:hypothetical protein